MSNVVTNIVKRWRGSAPQKSVLMCLADRADDRGFCWYAIPAICEWTCLSRNAVIAAMKYLEASKVVRVVRVSGQSNRTYIDVINVDLFANQSTAATGAPCAPVHEEYCTSPSGAPPPVHEMHYPSPSGAPDTSSHQSTSSAYYGESSLDESVSSQHGLPPRGEYDQLAQFPPTHPALKKTPRIKSQLPVDFQLNQNSIGYARERGIATSAELLKFKNYYEAKGREFADWQATWRSWCDKAVEFGRANGTVGQTARSMSFQEKKNLDRMTTLAGLTGRTIDLDGLTSAQRAEAERQMKRSGWNPMLSTGDGVHAPTVETPGRSLQPPFSTFGDRYKSRA